MFREVGEGQRTRRGRGRTEVNRTRQHDHCLLNYDTLAISPATSTHLHGHESVVNHDLLCQEIGTDLFSPIRGGRRGEERAGPKLKGGAQRGRGMTRRRGRGIQYRRYSQRNARRRMMSVQRPCYDWCHNIVDAEAAARR